jgi:DNA-binding transcriptional LysR family regulator
LKNINLRQLEAFRAVMLTKSITRAAEMLFVSQPAVSRLISDLESTVEFDLFHRVKKRLIPTPEGEALLEEVERSFAGLNKISLTAREIKEFRNGSVSIASLPALGLGYLPELITRFAEKYPEISLSLAIRGSQSVSSLIGAQRADVGFVESLEFNDSVDSELLLTSNLVCVMRKDHRLAEKESVEISDLNEELYVRSSNWQLTYRDIDRYFDSNNVKRKIQIDTHQNATVAEFVLAGAGIGIIDPVTADRFATRGLVSKAFTPSIPYNYYVIYPNDKPRSLLAEQFVAQVRKDIVRYAS